MKKKKISILGLGYIGLPTAIILANKQVNVEGYDINKNKIEQINKGMLPFVESGLKTLLKKALRTKHFKASNKLAVADVYVITVPTPFKYGNKKKPQPDLSYIESACNQISGVLKKKDLVILESTSPVGTTIKVSNWLSKKRKDLTFPHNTTLNPDINIAYCPERVLPGNVMNELENNDRVIGGVTTNCSKKAKNFYKLFCNGKCSLTDSKTAEMVKLAENSYRDNQVAFANELSMISEKLNVDVSELIKLSNLHPRVNILNPGPGVGGHCIAVDPWFLISSDENNSKLLQLSRQVNINKEKWVIRKVKQKLNSMNKATKKNIAILGLAFKPNIDDLRESPSVRIAKKLIENKYNVLCVEPNISNHEVFNLVSLSKALRSCDLILCLVKHKEFEKNSKLIASSKSTIIDICGLL